MRATVRKIQAIFGSEACPFRSLSQWAWNHVGRDSWCCSTLEHSGTSHCSSGFLQSFCAEDIAMLQKAHSRGLGKLLRENYLVRVSREKDSVFCSLGIISSGFRVLIQIVIPQCKLRIGEIGLWLRLIKIPSDKRRCPRIFLSLSLSFSLTRQNTGRINSIPEWKSVTRSSVYYLVATFR